MEPQTSSSFYSRDFWAKTNIPFNLRELNFFMFQIYNNLLTPFQTNLTSFLIILYVKFNIELIKMYKSFTKIMFVFKNVFFVTSWYPQLADFDPCGRNLRIFFSSYIAHTKSSLLKVTVIHTLCASPWSVCFFLHWFVSSCSHFP